MAELYTAVLDPTSGTITGQPATVTQRLVTKNGEVWSPNGQYLAYSSRRPSGHGEIPIIVIRSVQTGEEYELAPALRNFDLQDWSPDSRSHGLQPVAFRDQPSGVLARDHMGRSRVGQHAPQPEPLERDGAAGTPTTG